MGTQLGQDEVLELLYSLFFLFSGIHHKFQPIVKIYIAHMHYTILLKTHEMIYILRNPGPDISLSDTSERFFAAHDSNQATLVAVEMFGLINFCVKVVPCSLSCTKQAIEVPILV